MNETNLNDLLKSSGQVQEEFSSILNAVQGDEVVLSTPDNNGDSLLPNPEEYNPEDIPTQEEIDAFNKNTIDFAANSLVNALAGPGHAEEKAEIVFENYINTANRIFTGQDKRRIKREILHKAKAGRYDKMFALQAGFTKLNK